MLCKAISFDAWMTFIQPNPFFKSARAAAIAEAFGYEDSETLLEVSDRICMALDKRTDHDGVQYGFNERVEAIYRELFGVQPDFSTTFLSELDGEIGLLMELYPPLLLEDDFRETLGVLKLDGIKLAIVSNTGLVDGHHMRKAFQALGVWEFFDEVLFSNEVGVSKPNPLIYRELAKRLKVAPCRTIHVGDNLIADYYGALGSGLMALHLSQDTSIDSVKIPFLRSLRGLL